MDNLGIDEFTLYATLGNGISWLIGIGLQVALLVVALTVVRRHRPGDWHWIALPAALGTIQSVVGPLAGWGITAVLSRDSAESMIRGQAVIAVVGGVAYGVVFGLLIYGIARLARAPRDDVGT